MAVLVQLVRDNLQKAQRCKNFCAFSYLDLICFELYICLENKLKKGEKVVSKMKKKMFTLVELVSLVWLVICLVGAVGWCMNIYKFTQCDFETPYRAEVLRGIGIVPPVGAVMGYFDIKDGVEK